QIVHRVRKCTYARQHEFLCLPDSFGVICNLDRNVHAHEGLFNAAQIVDGIVDDCDHHSTPFVEGIPVTRGSLVTAMQNARAADLNIASAMWCEFLPYSTSTCRLTRECTARARKNSSTSSVLMAPTFSEGNSALQTR